ncbi:hypothetical protein ANTHELSMS3_00660 [Antarctobacter heliothermus]|uniref:Uracil DNA glycosylase superfamily protein n=1 Tax=Antarctobacter heliothermus TaxID=74033 RepID=A0A222DZK1_9RHOB|nr:hypothetical protein [Antarctobacter heliothermus]ASP19379.1 hypothetical protein ANTHELSMS3_00660 [Antarctobacter heliothermus]
MRLNSEQLWFDVIEASHHELFDLDYLFQQGQKFGAISACDDPSAEDGWERIDESVCRFEQASALPEVCWGFDLPLLFTPPKWNQRVVALVFQDPKRVPKADALEFSIATPWGFSSRRSRNKGIARKVWPCVEGLCSDGYGVYLTDAWKLFFAQGSEKKTKATQRMEGRVFALEMEALAPDLVCTFGRAAEAGLKPVKLDSDPLNLPHPNARGNFLRDFYGTSTGAYNEIGTATLSKIRMALPT